MRLALLCLVLGAAACGSGQSGPSAPAHDGEVADEGRAPDPEGKSWGGWRWKGQRDDCFFVVKNHCYAKLDAACAAAGCDEDHCLLAGGGPAKVSCEK